MIFFLYGFINKEPFIISKVRLPIQIGVFSPAITHSADMPNILKLADTVGVEHVGIGTDMDAVRGPVYDDYAAFHVIPDALGARGMSAEDIEKISGGNFMRVFAACAG